MELRECCKHIIGECWPEYAIVRSIGRGSFGYVFEVEREGFREAVKIVEVSFKEDEPAKLAGMGLDIRKEYARKKQKALEEVERMHKLKSPHVAHINDFRSVDDPSDEYRSFILIRMDLLTGLDKLKDRFTSCSAQEAASWAKKLCLDICDALAFCHAKGIIHRDIKPENILYSESGDFYLSDFGISRQLRDNVTTLTSTGTENYIAPEVITQKYDYSVDIYSLGLVLYQMVNHWRLPFLPYYPTSLTAYDYNAANSKRIAGDVFPMPDNCPADLANIIVMMCAHNPAKRFRNAQAVMYAVESLDRPHAASAAQPSGSRSYGARPDYGPSADPSRDEDKNSQAYANQNRKSGGLDKKTVFIAAALAAIIVAVCIGFLWAKTAGGTKTNEADAGTTAEETLAETEETQDEASGEQDETTQAQTEAATESEPNVYTEDTAMNKIESITDSYDCEFIVNAEDNLGYSYDYALFVHKDIYDSAPYIILFLNQQFTSFTFTLAFNSDVGDGADLTVEFYDNDTGELITAFDITTETKPQELTVSVEGVDFLKIYIDYEHSRYSSYILIADGIFYK